MPDFDPFDYDPHGTEDDVDGFNCFDKQIEKCLEDGKVSDEDDDIHSFGSEASSNDNDWCASTPSVTGRRASFCGGTTANLNTHSRSLDWTKFNGASISASRHDHQKPEAVDYGYGDATPSSGSPSVAPSTTSLRGGSSLGRRRASVGGLLSTTTAAAMMTKSDAMLGVTPSQMYGYGPARRASLSVSNHGHGGGAAARRRASLNLSSHAATSTTRDEINNMTSSELKERVRRCRSDERLRRRSKSRSRRVQRSRSAEETSEPAGEKASIETRRSRTRSRSVARSRSKSCTRSKSRSKRDRKQQGITTNASANSLLDPSSRSRSRSGHQRASLEEALTSRESFDAEKEEENDVKSVSTSRRMTSSSRVQRLQRRATRRSSIC